MLDGSKTSGLFTTTEGLIYFGEGARTHIHLYEDETVYIVNGTVQFYVDGEQFCAPAGTTISIPRNINRSVRNLDPKPALVRYLFTPAGRENYLRKITLVYDQEPINYTRAQELALQYGQINLNEAPWQDLNCISNADISLKLGSHIILLVSQFYILTLVYS